MRRWKQCCTATVAFFVVLPFTFVVTATNTNKRHILDELRNIISSAKDELDTVGSVKANSINNENNNTTAEEEGNVNHIIDDIENVFKDQIWSVTTTVKDLTTQYQEIIDLQNLQSSLIDEVNVYQMKRFMTKLHDLSDTYPEVYAKLNMPTPKKEDDNASKYLTLSKLKEMLSPVAVLKDVDQLLHDYLYQHISADEDDTIKELIKKAQKKNKKKKFKKSKKTIRPDSSDDCYITGLDAAITVQEELIQYTNDYIGMKDIIQDGATIVHEMTSLTYQGTGISELDRIGTRTLGDAWFRKYIPQDWETYVLPSGWENYLDPTNSIIEFSNHWFRALGFVSTSDPYPSIIQNNLNAIPETIFHPTTTPGSCWPMQGSNGFITIRLATPVQHVSKITIDHVSALNVLDPKVTMTSAPKQIKVHAFPTCDEGCTSNGLNFDVSSKRLMTAKPLLYDINHTPGQTSSVQTFTLEAVNASHIIDEFTDEDTNSCSPYKPSCVVAVDAGRGMTGKTDTAAIQIEILDNWGKQDYTCIYRIRLHEE